MVKGENFGCDQLDSKINIDVIDYALAGITEIEKSQFFVCYCCAKESHRPLYLLCGEYHRQDKDDIFITQAPYECDSHGFCANYDRA